MNVGNYSNSKPSPTASLFRTSTQGNAPR